MLAEVLEKIETLSPEARESLSKEVIEATKGMEWIPNPGPQTAAYYSEADELFYGGQAGGGKTDLIIGLALNEHKNSLILRRTNKEAEKLPTRIEDILGHDKGLNRSTGTWKTDGKVIDMGGCQLESDKQKRKGIPHDLKAFDEVSDFTESQYTFICAWNRSADPKQRCRVVATGNPPTRAEGYWVIR
ncbi:MAG: terminase, partial [Candidatus Thorarchaeota archaeon]